MAMKSFTPLQFGQTEVKDRIEGADLLHENAGDVDNEGLLGG
jgi:hypothetical protein